MNAHEPRCHRPRVLLVLAAAGLLAACGSDDEGSSATTTAAAPSTAASTQAPTTEAATATTAAAATETTAAAQTTTAETPAATTAGGEPVIAAASSANFGDIVVDQAGFSLYLYTMDSEGTSSCTGGCAEAWPPVLTEDDPVVGDGLDQTLVGTVTRDDGSTQVTYGGHPLYRFGGDIVAGDTNGQDVGEVWYLVDTAGMQVE